MANDNLNGSVDLLANAMRKVFSEAVEGAVKPLTLEVKAITSEVKAIQSEVKAIKSEVKAMRSDINDLKEENQTTRDNVQSQLASHRKEVNRIISDQK